MRKKTSIKTSSSVNSDRPSNVEMRRIDLHSVADVAKLLGVSESSLIEAAHRWVTPIDERLTRLAEARRRAQLMGR